ncbi:MAG: translocation/assembly module TamB domain-containing protein [Chitinispirillaceae bacterium]|nr:translocation/assembly module TamB domain-containing protein [Chitinispirillaceae bacterium]
MIDRANKSAHTFIRLLVLAVSLGMALFFAACIALLSAPVQKKIISSIEPTISKALGSHVSIGSLRTNFINRIELHDCSLTDVVPYGDSLHVNRVRVAFKLAPLLRKKLVLQRVVIHDGGIVCVRTLDGRFHAPFLPARDSVKASKPKKKTTWCIIIDTVSIKKLDARYIDSALSIDASLTRIDAGVRFYALDSLLVRLSTGAGNAVTPWWLGTIRSLSADGVVSASSLELAALRLDADSASVIGKGTVAYGKGGIWDLSVEASTTRNALCILDRIPVIKPGGTMRARATWQGTIEQPSLTVNASAAGMTVDRLTADTLLVDMRYDTQGDLDARIRTITRFGAARLKVSAGFPGLMTGPKLNRYMVAASVPNVALTDALRHFGIDGAFPRARAELNISGGGRSFTALPDTLCVEALLWEPEISRKSNRIDISVVLNQKEWDARLSDLAGNTIQTSGVLGHGDSVSGEFGFSILRPSAITRFFLLDTISGTGTGNGSFAGTFCNPTITAGIRGENLAWKSVVVNRFSGAVTYREKKLRIDRAVVKTKGSLDSMLSAFGIKTVSGSYALEACASGTLEDPDLSARVSVRAFRGFGCRFSSMDLAASLLHDTLRIGTMRLLADSASILCHGKASLFAKDRFFMLDLSADRHGCDRAKIEARATLDSSDTLQAACTVSSLTPRHLAPWIERSPPINGTLTLDARCRGASHNPEATLSLDFFQTFEQERRIDYHAEVLLQDSLARAKISATAGTVKQPLTVSASLPLSYGKPWNVRNSIRDGARITARGADVNVRELVESFAPSIKAGGRLTLDAEARLASGKWALSGSAASQMHSLQYSEIGVLVDSLRAQAIFDGNKTAAMARLEFSTSRISWQDRSIDALNGAVRYGTDTIRIDTIIARLGDGSLFVTGKTPLTALDKQSRGEGIRLRFHASDLPLSAAGPFGEGVRLRDGTVTARGTVEIRGGKPVVQGRASVNKALLQVFECSPPLGPVNISLVMAGDSLAVESFKGNLGPAGRFRGAGYALMKEPNRARISFLAKDLRLQCADLDAGVTSARVRVVDSADAFVVSGDIDLAETRFATFFSPNMIADQFDRPRQVASEKKNPFLDRVSLRGRLTINRNLIIETNIGRFVLDGQVAIVGTPNKPGAIGAIEITEGHVFYLDRRFTIDKGMFRLQDPEAIRPLVDLAASARVIATNTGVRGGEINEESYTITLRIQGDLEKPEVILTADPALRPPQIVSLLTFGTTQGEIGGDISQRVESILKQQLAGFGTRKLEQWLNIESLNVEPVGKKDAVVTAVKRLSPRLTVSYQTTVEDITKQKAMASYRLLPFLYIDGTGDYAGRVGADLRLRWSR